MSENRRVNENRMILPPTYSFPAAAPLLFIGKIRGYETEKTEVQIMLDRAKCEQEQNLYAMLNNTGARYIV